MKDSIAGIRNLPQHRRWEPQLNTLILKKLLPREHGSWAILLIPYCLGAIIAGGFSPPSILGLVGCLLLFICRRPLIILLKSRKSREDTGPLLWMNFVVPALSGLSIFIWLLFQYNLWYLFLFGFISVLVFFAHTLLTLQRQERTIIGEFLGILVLTVSAPLAYYLYQHVLTASAVVLWFLNALYFGASVFYVKMRLILSAHNDRPSRRFTHERNILIYLSILLFVLVILSLGKLAPISVVLAFVPMMAHTLWSLMFMPQRLNITRQGFVQVGLSLVFAVLIIMSYKVL
ncbi:MAG: YwiC-like family protein [Gemmatimonadota bacterium]|nr:MAG: YwiC-like family protein [Gemmatimonadota bacterium]